MAAMKKEISTKKNKMKQTDRPSFFVCHQCGTGIPVFKEIFTTDSAKTYKLELIQQSCLHPEVIDEIEIGTKKKGRDLKLTFCGFCYSVVRRVLMSKAHVEIAQLLMKDSCEASA